MCDQFPNKLFEIASIEKSIEHKFNFVHKADPFNIEIGQAKI